MVDRSALRVGVVCWYQDDGLASLFSGTLAGLGCEIVSLLHDARLPSGLDVLLVYGPMGSIVPIAKQLLGCVPSERPTFVYWMTEQLANPKLPEWLRYMMGMVQSRAERLTFHEQAAGQWRADSRLSRLIPMAHRHRYYGDLHWLRQQGLLSVLAVGSRWIADFLRARGFDPVVAYLGSHPDWWADLGLERDIPVLWIGKAGTDRRRLLLQRVRAGLEERGVKMLMVDGVESPYVFGEERTVLLNRAKVVLNILRTKWDNHSLRYFLAASNRALIVTEPTLPHTPFLAGVHLAEAPTDKLADTICYYLSHEEERRQITDRAHQLVTTQLTTENAVGQILERVAAVRRDEA